MGIRDNVMNISNNINYWDAVYERKCGEEFAFSQIYS